MSSSVIYDQVLRRWLVDMDFDLADSEMAHNHDLEAATLRAFEDLNLTTGAGKYWQTMKHAVPISVSYAEKTLPQFSFEIRLCNSIYCCLLLYCDIITANMDAEMAAEFQTFVITRGAVFKNPYLGYIFPFIKTEVSKYYGPVAACSIMKATVDFCVGCIIEGRRVQTPNSAPRFPQWLRSKVGVSEGFGIFIFPQSVFDESEYLSAWLPAIPDMVNMIDKVNDILSFYKESIVADDEDNFIMTTARLRKCDPLQVLAEICQQQLELNQAIEDTLGKKSKELREAWKIYMRGYIMWHVTSPRYRLMEMDVVMGSKRTTTAVKAPQEVGALDLYRQKLLGRGDSQGRKTKLVMLMVYVVLLVFAAFLLSGIAATL